MDYTGVGLVDRGTIGSCLSSDFTRCLLEADNI